MMGITTPVSLILLLVLMSFVIPPVFAVPDDFDHYVSFHMRANAFAPNYAYDLITRGEPSDGSQWVYNFYMFGYDGDGQNGRIAVYSGGQNLISPVSVPLSPGTDYYVVWHYSDTMGGELFINNISQGPPVGDGSLHTSRSTSFHVGENMYRGGGRQHSPFNGAIWDVYHYEKDMAAVSTSSTVGDSGHTNTTSGFTVGKSLSPISIKQGTDARITIMLINNGTTPVHDIELLDETLPEFPVTSGETKYVIPSGLQPNETRILSYTVTGTKAGRYVLGKAQVMYSGEDGNYHLISSGAPSVEVLEPLISQGPGNPVTSSSGDIMKPLYNFMKLIFP